MSHPLNAPQREAVRHVDGPLLVLAGAGSGKTRVITAKIAYLIERGVDPPAIAAITFTNKAAREMRERASKLLAAQGRGGAARQVAISTFHSLGLSILRAEARTIGLKPGFSILDPTDLETLVAELVGTADRARARAAQWKISGWKNALVTPERAIANAGSDDELAAARAYASYGEALSAWQAVDFDDLIVKPVELFEQNYRSSVRILRCANALIANNAKLFDKRLWSEHGHGDTIRVTVAIDDEAESELVVHRLLAHKFEHRGSFADYAILYRGNHQARVFETALRAQNVPYAITGGQSYFDRAEIKDIVAYLRLLVNDEDDPAFIRAVTTPKRGVGPTTLKRLSAIATSRRESLFAAVLSPEFEASARGSAREELGKFCALVNDLRLRAPREPAGRLATELVRKIGYDDWLLSTFDKRDAQARSKSVGDFVDWLTRKGEGDRKTLLELTQTISLITMLEGRDGEQSDAVLLSTLHAAKGLEFPHVFMVGLEEGILPHRESIERGTVDEERRLMYVGITRAQRSLSLSYCRTRRRAGGKVDAIPSRFIRELAQDDLRYADMPLPPAEAARERTAGAERLKALKARVAK